MALVCPARRGSLSRTRPLCRRQLRPRLLGAEIHVFAPVVGRVVEIGPQEEVLATVRVVDVAPLEYHATPTRKPCRSRDLRMFHQRLEDHEISRVEIFLEKAEGLIRDLQAIPIVPPSDFV